MTWIVVTVLLVVAFAIYMLGGVEERRGCGEPYCEICESERRRKRSERGPYR